MPLMNIEYVVEEIKVLAERVGWCVDEIRVASTGSTYIELVRDDREWCVIRVADHKQVYYRWLTTYSVAPGDMWFEELEELLLRPFGEVGDILL